MNRARIVEALEETTIPCGCDDTGCNRQPVFWGDVASDAALDALAPTVEALIREAVREALTQAASIAAMPGLGNEYAIMAYRDEHYPEGES